MLFPAFIMAQTLGDSPLEYGTLDDLNKGSFETESIFALDLEDNINPTRLIEPTSPILGSKLVQEIKDDQRHPSEILRAIGSKYQSLKDEIVVSSIAYYNALLPGLVEYRKQSLVSTKPVFGMQWTEVEPAAIPLEVLTPLHFQYKTLVDSAHMFQQKQGYELSRDSAIQLAITFGNLKATSPTVLSVLRPNNFYTRVLPHKVAKLIQLNAQISSAEAAYPRLQHSINGYLQHTYSYLLQHNDLEGLLAAGYDAQNHWIESSREGEMNVPFMSYIEKAVLEEGYSHRDALILLCYSTRNMPNLDVQYSMNPENALALEVFFWKFKELQNLAVDQFFDNVFPNHVFKENPMLYHYATASYLAYEVERAGYRNVTAVSMAFLSKAGYKFHKFVTALDPRKFNHQGVGHFKELLASQSSVSGVQAGYYGGLHGVAIAKMEDRSSIISKRGKLLAAQEARLQLVE